MKAFFKNSPLLILSTLTAFFAGCDESSTVEKARAPAMPEILTWTNDEDHGNMVEQLGIQELRRWKNGRAQAGEEGAANYDEAVANPYTEIPALLVLDNGEEVTSEEMWWQKRRPEIAEHFEREIYGRLPKNIPSVDWQVVKETVGEVGGVPVTGKRLAGVVDNSSYPQIDVSISMTVVLPTNVKGPVPVLMMFSWRDEALPGEETDGSEQNRRGRQDILPSTEQLIAAGWGYAKLNPKSVQEDNGAGLTRGIIGLVNKGQARNPEDWGSLRAWAWGAARGLDYLETLPEVDAKKIGIEGVSRYGKAALVTMAFEDRFAMVLVGSSGKGGAGLHRRNFGEAVENLTSSGEYHWMAGNYLKYGTEKSIFGRMDANDMPVESHQLIAMCAPRPTFISYGIPEKGDALWLDQLGSYMATVAAQPAFELLGAKGIGVTEDFRTAQMPAVSHGLVDGQLAWRQHDGGHESQSNISHFIKWANEQIGYE